MGVEGMRSFVLDIIVIELFFVGGFPLEEASEQSLIKVLFLVLFTLVLFWYC
jgi:hypothetical protein